MRNNPPSPPNPSPVPGPRGPDELALWDRLRREVADEVENASTPVSDSLGEIKVNKPPSQVVFGEKRNEIEKEYGWTGLKDSNYLDRVAPIRGNWDGGYWLNAFAALKRIEKQLSFFKLNGKTPLEEATARFNEIRQKKNQDENLKRRIGRREKELEGLFGGKTRKGKKTRKSKKSRKVKKTRRTH